MRNGVFNPVDARLDGRRSFTVDLPDSRARRKLLAADGKNEAVLNMGVGDL